MPVPSLHLTTLPPTVTRGELTHSGELLDVEQARELVASVRRRPWQGDRTVIHLTAAHRVRDDVWNTLLKVLEEPPPYAVFHLYAPSTDAIPRTIRSRCRLLREQLPDPSTQDATRLVRIYEGPDVLTMVREGDRHTDKDETIRQLEGLWVYAAQTGRVDCALLSEYYLESLRRGASPRIVVKALLTELARRHRVSSQQSSQVP